MLYINIIVASFVYFSIVDFFYLFWYFLSM